MDSLDKYRIWTFVQRHVEKKIVGCKWINKIKVGISENELKSYKAIVMAKGFTKHKEIDYTEVFSLVVRHTSIRVLLALTVNLDL